MKNLRLTLSLLAVSVTLGFGQSAFAQNFPRPATRPTQSELQGKSGFRVYESDQHARADMELSREIFAQRQVAALAPAKFDRDGNGRFDQAELKAWLAAVRSAIPASPGAMTRFDTNRNGQLDADEWSVVLESLVGKA